MFIGRLTLLLIFLMLQGISYAISSSNDQPFLVFTDVHVDADSTRRMDLEPRGRYFLNELDPLTFHQFIDKLALDIRQGRLAKPKFILFPGDITRHIRLSDNAVSRDQTLFFNEITQAFPDIPVFYTFGNNDAYAVNYGAFTTLDKDGNPSSPLTMTHRSGAWDGHFLSTKAICKAKPSQTPCILSENTQDGYYSAYIEPGLRFIALNTVMFSVHASMVTNQEVTNQLGWFERQLQDAAAHHESVLIAMHVPPGSSVYDNRPFWQPEPNSIFLKLVALYQSNIIGILAGHTHQEELKVIQNKAHQNIAAVYFTAGMSTTHGNAPSFKLFTYARQENQWQLTNYDTYTFSRSTDDRVTIDKLYNFKEYYCHGQSTRMLGCFQSVTADRMMRYFEAGNKNYAGKISYPQHMIVPILNDNAQ